MKSCSRCLVCNHTANSGDTHVNIFSSPSLDGAGSLASRLENILQVQLELSSCHTVSLCQRCRDQTAEIEGYYRIIEEFRSLYHETARLYKQEESRPEDLNSLIDTGLLELEKLLGIDHDDPSVQALLKAESSYRHDSEADPQNAGGLTTNTLSNDVSRNPAEAMENDSGVTGSVSTRGQQAKRSGSRGRTGRSGGSDCKAGVSQKLSKGSKQSDANVSQKLKPSTEDVLKEETDIKPPVGGATDIHVSSKSDTRVCSGEDSHTEKDCQAEDSPESRQSKDVVTEDKPRQTGEEPDTQTAPLSGRTVNQSTDNNALEPIEGVVAEDSSVSVSKSVDSSNKVPEVKVTPGSRKRRHNQSEAAKTRPEPMSLRKRPPRQAALRVSKRCSTGGATSQTSTSDPPQGGASSTGKESETKPTSMSAAEPAAKKLSRATEPKPVKNSEAVKVRSNLNPYKCSSCPDAFKTRHDFYRHIRTCGKAYQQSGKAALHAQVSPDQSAAAAKGRDAEGSKESVPMETDSEICKTQEGNPGVEEEKSPTTKEVQSPSVTMVATSEVTENKETVLPTSVEPSHITSITKATPDGAELSAIPDPGHSCQKEGLKEEAAMVQGETTTKDSMSHSIQDEATPTETRQNEMNKMKIDSSKDERTQLAPPTKPVLPPGGSFTPSSPPAVPSSSYATSPSVGYLGVVGPPTTLEASQQQISLQVQAQASPAFSMGPQPGNLHPVATPAERVSPLHSPQQSAHVPQRPLGSGMYTNYPRPPAYGAPHYIQQERPFMAGARQRQMRPTMMANNFSGNRATFMPPAPPYRHPVGQDSFHMTSQQQQPLQQHQQQHLQHMQQQQQQHFHQQPLPQSQQSPLGEGHHPGQVSAPASQISNGPQFPDSSFPFMDPSTSFREGKGPTRSPQPNAPGPQMYHAHPGGFVGVSPPPPHQPDSAPASHHSTMVSMSNMLSPGGHMTNTHGQPPHHPRHLPHAQSSPSSHQGAANFQNQHQGMGHSVPVTHQGAAQGPAVQQGRHTGNPGQQGSSPNMLHQGAPHNMLHQGAPQNMPHQVAPPHNMQHQAPPHNMSHRGTPQNMPHQGAPHNMQHQGAPHNMQHQVVPPQNISHQTVPHNMPQQGTPQNMHHSVPLQHPPHTYQPTSTPPAQSSHSPHQSALGASQHSQPPPQPSHSLPGVVPSSGSPANKPGNHFGIQPALQHSPLEGGQFKPPQESGFPCASALVNLAKTHTEPKPFKCTICEASFFNADILMDHIRVHEDSDHPEDVDRSSSNATPASKDVSPQPSPSPRPKKERNKNKEKSWRCAKCNVTCLNAEDWAEHRKAHMGEKAYLCPSCGVAFAAKWYLTRHQRTHSGEKPHKCEVCGKAFGRPDHLRKHMTTHSTKPNCVLAL